MATFRWPRSTTYCADLRNDAYTQLDVLPAADILQEAFVVPPDGARQPVGTFDPRKFTAPDKEKNPSHYDQLSGDVEWLKKLTAAPTTTVTEAEMRFLTEFTREWATGEATPIVIFEQIVELIDEILSGSVFKNIDFARIREEVEDYLLSLVPSKIRMGYDFNIELGDEIAKATAGIFSPKPGTRLGIDMKIVIDLLKATQQGDVDIDFRSVGTLGPFDIKLVGKMFDAADPQLRQRRVRHRRRRQVRHPHRLHRPQDRPAAEVRREAAEVPRAQGRLRRDHPLLPQPARSRGRLPAAPRRLLGRQPRLHQCRPRNHGHPALF